MPVELCALFALIALIVAVVVVGHFTWVVCAAIWKELFPGEPPRPAPRRADGGLTRCAGCGKSFRNHFPRCPFCNLAPDSPEARELRELESTARHIQLFRDAGSLDPAVCDQVYRCIEERQRVILDDLIPPARPARPVARPAQPVAVPVAVPAEEEPLEVMAAVDEEPVPAPAPTPAPPPAAPPPVPRRSFGELLAAFMEERNILWGELVGGLLIVGCSIALVISLWRTLRQIPFFPFILLAGFTSLLFGAGFYTLRHWKLETTSRGLLAIALLLVPLDFIVLANLSEGTRAGMMELATAIAAIAVFVLLVRMATHILIGPTLTPGGRRTDWLATVAVLGPAAVQLLVPRVMASDEPVSMTVLLLGLLPAACHGLTLGAATVDLGRQGRITVGQSRAMFGFLGIATFALGTALAFLLYWGEATPAMLHAVAVPIALGGVPLLVAGAVVQQKLAGDAVEHLRVAATVVALTGFTVLVVALVLACPVPLVMIATALIGTLSLAFVALAYRRPIGHIPGLVFLTAAYLTGFHVVTGDLGLEGEQASRLVRLLLAPESGVALVALGVIFAIASEGYARLRRLAEGRIHAVAAGVLGVVSLALVSRDALANPGRAAVVYGICVTVGLLANLRWHRAAVTYALVAVLFGFLFHGVTWTAPDMPVARRLLLAFLADSSLALFGRLVFQRGTRPWAVRVFEEPFFHAALLGTLGAVASLPFALGWGWFMPASLCALWLAGLWLVLAGMRRVPELFTAFQAAITASVLLAVTAWLERQSWVLAHAGGLLDPWSLQAYGVGLGLLAIGWAVVRVVSARQPAASMLIEAPDYPGFDRVILALVIVMQTALAVWAVAPGVALELTPGALTSTADWSPAHVHALGWGAWLVTALFAGALVVGLWEEPRTERLLGLVLMAATATVLWAGWFRDERAVASALRWGLAVCFVLGSVLLWGREPIRRLATRVSIPPRPSLRVEPVRALLIACTIPAVLIITAIVTGMGLAGRPPIGPEPYSFFTRIGWLGSQIPPLVLVAFGLSGHAVRERAPGYAFAAGLVAIASVVGGYALGVSVWTEAEAVRLWQLGTITAGVWALGWVAVRPWVEAWREVPGRPHARSLMLVQLGLGVAGNAVLLAGAIGPLLFLGPPVGTILPAFPPSSGWTLEAGSILGWLALGFPAAAIFLRASQQRSLGVYHWVATVVLAGVALAACVAEQSGPGAGFQGLLLGWGVVLMIGTFVTWPQTPSSGWAAALGTVVVALGLKAAFVHGHQVLGAAGVSLASLAWAVMAWEKRHEAWAFASALSVNLVVSLSVWYAHLGLPFGSWSVLLAQANLLTAGVTALAWLAARDVIYRGELRLTPRPLLAILVTLPLVGHLVLLTPPLLHMLSLPGSVPPVPLVPHGHWLGALALVVNLIAALRYFQLALPVAVVHVVAVGGLMLGVTAGWSLAVQTAGTTSRALAWLPHHVLALVWTLLGIFLLTAGWVGTLPRVGPILWAPERRKHAADRIRAMFPATAVRHWVEVLGLFVVFLALRGAWGDPTRPYLSSAVTLAVSVLYGALAVWSRRPLYVYFSGLLFTLVGYLVWQSWLINTWHVEVWLAWGPSVLDVLLWIEVLCLAIASAIWLVIDLSLRERPNPIDLRRRLMPFSYAAILLALQLAAILVIGALAADVTGEAIHLGGTLPWWALGAIVVPLLLALWDFDAERWGMPMPALYVIGLLAVGLGLHLAEPPNPLWPAALALAGYGFVTASLGRFLWTRRRLWLTLGWPHYPEPWPARWFAGALALTAALAVALSVRTALSTDPLLERLAGPLTVTMLVLTAMVLARGRLPLVRDVTLALGVLVLIEAGWALLDPAIVAPWLHRNVVVMVSLGLAAVGYGVVLPRMLTDAGWLASARRAVGASTVLTACMLAVVLLQEFFLYNPDTRCAPLASPAVAVVALTLVLILAALLYLALNPERDPLGRTPTGRVTYVYTAEVVLALVFVHLRLCIPDLFPSFIGKYWPLTVMVIAFVGMGVGELFDRRVPVLSSPLRRTGIFLPIIPLLAYLIYPGRGALRPLGDVAPGMQPFLRMLENLPAWYQIHALVWFLAGTLYAVIAIRQRSSPFGLVAALMANFGLWVILGNQDGLEFLTHPQLWLIPMGLIILAAEHLHRSRLTPAQSQALRVAGALVIYVASTADMFIAGLGESVLMPITLALLSVLGVLLGILLRVRAFLFLGAAFLFLVVFSQIWHAAVDLKQTWLWWASGIVLGIAILTLFALFEKRRNDLLRMMEDLKHWD